MTYEELHTQLAEEYDRIIAETLRRLRRKKPLTREKIAKALFKANKAYWTARLALLDDDAVVEAERVARALAVPYAHAAEELSDQVRHVFSGYQSAFNLTQKDAEELLEHIVYDRSVAENLRTMAAAVTDSEEKTRIMAELSAPAYRYRMQRAEQIAKNAQETLESIARNEVRTDRTFMQTEIEKAYNISLDEPHLLPPSDAVIIDLSGQSPQNTGYMPRAEEPVRDFTPTTDRGIMDSFTLVNDRAVKEIIDHEWKDGNFSERIWSNTDELAREVKQVLLEGELTGASEAKMAAKIEERFHVGMYKARRVVRTESNYCINQAELKGMKDAGFDEYEFISLGENAEDVCDTCDDLDGERFKISEAAVGVNCPPMHPFCRCKVTTPQETLEDIQADIDRMLEGTSIEEIEQRLDQMIAEREQIGTTENSSESVDKFENSGIMEVGKEETTENDMLILSSKFINPNDELYRYADRIDPEPGFSDIVCHGDPHFLLIHGMDGEEWEYSAKQAAEMIKNSNEFKGEPIRLIACQTGAEENGIAQQISDILKVPVKAPTESVYVNLKGEMFITDNAFLADLWEKGGNVQETGKWTMFYPREE